MYVSTGPGLRPERAFIVPRLLRPVYRLRSFWRSTERGLSVVTVRAKRFNRYGWIPMRQFVVLLAVAAPVAPLARAPPTPAPPGPSSVGVLVGVPTAGS